MTSKRDNRGKAQLSYILEFPRMVTAFARVMELGALKYDPGNWKLGGKPDKEYLDATMRHIVAFQSGEEFASDSGCHHLAHAAWNLFALVELNVDTPVNVNKFVDACEYWEKVRGQPND